MSDSISHENKACRNCDSKIASSDLFCNYCGQKYITGRVTLKDVLGSFFSELFSIDSRIYRSFLALLVPGKLTVEYFKGRHKSFAPPLRIFIVSSLILITSISAFLKKNPITKTDFKQINKLNKLALLNEIDSIQVSLKDHYKSEEAHQALDSLNKILKQEKSSQSHLRLMRFELPFQIVFAKEVDYADVYNLSEEAIFEKYNVQAKDNQWFARQQLKIVKDPSGYQAFIIGRITIITLLLMPIVALLLKLLYIRKKRFYVEHFIFSMHYHSFAFLMIALLLFIWLLGPIHAGMAASVLILVGMVYLFFAMKQVYQQNVWKTLLKFCLLNLSYLIFLSFFLSSIFMASFLLF